ncbi:TPA: hypothetical protein NJZ47_001635 [Vibrio parahaemolyticus]|nr:hypothetical protein [Vibrio parahaemolyticus]
MKNNYENCGIDELKELLSIKKHLLYLADQELNKAFEKQIECALEVRGIEEHLNRLKSIPQLIKDIPVTLRDISLGNTMERCEIVDEIRQNIRDISNQLSSVQLKNEYLNLEEESRFAYFSNICDAAKMKLLSELDEYQVNELQEKEKESQKRLDEILKDI